MASALFARLSWVMSWEGEFAVAAITSKRANGSTDLGQRGGLKTQRRGHLQHIRQDSCVSLSAPRPEAIPMSELS